MPPRIDRRRAFGVLPPALNIGPFVSLRRMCPGFDTFPQLDRSGIIAVLGEPDICGPCPASRAVQPCHRLPTGLDFPRNSAWSYGKPGIEGRPEAQELLQQYPQQQQSAHPREFQFIRRHHPNPVYRLLPPSGHELRTQLCDGVITVLASLI